jgi:hypothetical protein
MCILPYYVNLDTCLPASTMHVNYQCVYFPYYVNLDTCLPASTMHVNYQCVYFPYYVNLDTCLPASTMHVNYQKPCIFPPVKASRFIRMRLILSGTGAN